MTDPREPIFSAIRTAGKAANPAWILREDQLKATHDLLDALKIPRAVPETGPTIAAPKALADPAAFFAAVRASFGALDNDQVQGFNAVVAAMGAAGWPIAWAAYGLATSWHETARTMKPVREAYWLSEDWRRKNLRYFPHYGRGYVQLTWEANYKKADDELGLGGSLVAKLDRAMEPEIAAKIMVRGMTEGWFTGKKLADYLPTDRPATTEEFRPPRRIINAMDKASEIAALAFQFQGALGKGRWS